LKLMRWLDLSIVQLFYTCDQQNAVSNMTWSLMDFLEVSAKRLLVWLKTGTGGG
jgi:hypothetical protein